MVIFTDFHDHKKLELERTLNPLFLFFLMCLFIKVIYSKPKTQNAKS